MKHLEVSRKIKLSKKTSPEELKSELLDRLGKSIAITKSSDGVSDFTVSGTTGAPASITRYARVDLDVSVRTENDIARILISGYSRPALSLTLLYGFLFLVVLVVGLLPGSIETDADASGAADALVFLIFGIYIAYDINRKISEPTENLASALESLDTTLG